MRILKVTETYFPFLEKGGPPVKVRALARGLARRGHQVTVLTADFGIVRDVCSAATPCEFGWRTEEEDGVEAVYLPSLLRYRALTWNPKARPFWDSRDRKSTRLNSSHDQISYAVFCLKKKKKGRARDR